jgi:two-component system NtrC family sensor kinase
MIGARAQILLTVVGIVVVGFGLIFLAANPLLGQLRADVEICSLASPDAPARFEAVRTLIMLFMGLAILLVSVMGYVALTLAIVRPLDRTMRAIERVQAGDRSARAKPSGGRELRQLAAAFNRLAAQLEADDARIEQQIDELTRVNEQLNRAQSSLVRSEKLASVGRLAAGVAHEIGNPIGIVLGYLDLLRGDVAEADRTQYLNHSREATERISVIIRDLLDFSRPAPPDGLELGDAGRVVRGTLQLLVPQQAFVGVTIENTIDAEARLPVAIADNRLQQVVLNVLLNAADAMRGHTEDPRLVVSAQRSDDSITIQIADNGPGVPPDERIRIFDPFYSTKDPGAGTGLGLAICHSILNSHGGDIHVEPGQESGAVFVITCPAP